MMLEVIKTDTYERWFRKLRDKRARARILVQERRVQNAGKLVGDWKDVGGVKELRIKYGPGYRLYIAIEHGKILLLLVGGDKGSQQRDIEKARELLREWRLENG